MAEAPTGESAPLTFEAVFNEYATFVFRILRRLGVRDADADDVCQDVFVIVHRRLATVRGAAAVRSWVYGICLRVAADYRKKVRRAREEPQGDGPEPGGPAEQEEDLDRRRDLAWLDEELDRLDGPRREVFVLHVIEQVPMAEVAAAVGCPLQTAYSRLYAAKRDVAAAARREQARRSNR
jgi:RNA polymerase sigma-70 factor (ECF subfamily)